MSTGSRQIAGSALVETSVLELDGPEDQSLLHLSRPGYMLDLVGLGERQILVVLKGGGLVFS